MMTATGKQRIHLVMTAVLAVNVGCSRPSAVQPTIPYTGETESVSLTVYDPWGSSLAGECVLYDDREIREIIDCLTPPAESDFAKVQMKGPIIGRIQFRGPRGVTTVEFTDAGTNPLCFRVGEKAFIRGSPGYRGYRSDHKRLYGVESEHVNEAMGLHAKLMKFVADNKAHPEEKPQPPPKEGK